MALLTGTLANRIDTTTLSISDLITGIKRGEIKIPQFQRKFVWKDEQALELLDSIAQNYPVGSLLLWKTQDKLKAERNIGQFRLPSTDDMTPTDYVLDGQQRLTVVYSSLGAPQDEEGFTAIYDLEEEKFIRYAGKSRAHHFPLRLMYQTTSLLNFRTTLLSNNQPPIYQDRLDSLIHVFNSYKIPVVTLKDLTIEQVCPIFERINSSGTKLSTFDLMVAATWTKNFDLNEEIDDVCEALRPKSFEDIEKNTVLKCLSAIQLGTIKEDALKTLRELSQSDIKNLIDKSKKALLRTVDLLSTEFSIYNWEFLTYEAFVIVIAYIYSKNPVLDHEQVSRLKQWFWTASFAERFKVGGGANVITRELNLVYKFVVENVHSDFGSIPNESEWKELVFRNQVSRTRAFILALAHRKPKNITNGSLIDISEALSVYNKKQFHHVYPKAYLKRIGIINDDNVLANICMLAAESNNIISDSTPSIYLPELANKLGENADEIFLSNLLPPPSTFDYVNNDYSSFLDARSVIIAEHIKSLCTGK